MVGMPAKDEEGNGVEGSDTMFYCDAFNTGGTKCPQFYNMTANTYGFRSSSHDCDEPNENGHYDSF